MEALLPVFTFLGEIAGPVSSVFSAIGAGEKLFGGGSSSTPAAATPATAPTTPNISPADYTNQQNQYYQQMLAGLGMGTEGNQLPQGLQDAISKQAALL